MKLFSVMKCLLRFIKKVTRLNGILQSETTASQYKIALPLAVLFAILGFIIPEYAEPQMVAAIMAVIAPIIARIALWRDNSDAHVDLPDAMIIKAQKAKETVWHELHGTLLDAKQEGYKFAVSEDGTIYDVDNGLPTGAKLRMPNPAPQGAVKAFVDKLKQNKENETNE